MKMSWMIPVLAMACVAALSGAGRGPWVQPEPVQVAQEFLDQVRDGKAIESIERLYDATALLENAFGEDFAALSEAEKKYTVTLAETSIKATLSIPRIVDAMKKSKIEGLAVADQTDDSARVTFQMTMPGDEKPDSNALILHRRGGEWRVVEQLHSGKGVTEGLRIIYDAVKPQGGTVVTALETMAQQSLKMKLDSMLGPPPKSPKGERKSDKINGK